MPGDRGFFKYVGKAFVIPWNLLAVGALSVLGVIAGYPEVAFPLVAAGEVVFLAGLAANSKFQRAIDAQEHKELKGKTIQSKNQQIDSMLEAMSWEDQSRFEKLKEQCVNLRRIARGVKGQTGDDSPIVADLQSGGMNRLLWIYLKLLYSKASIERFFETIDEKQIVGEIDRAETRLAALGPIEEDTATEQRRRASLEDNISTSRARLDNYNRAKENYEFIQDEIARVSSKIASLAEMSINRQDPDFITHEVDSVTASVQNSEQAMSELEFLTGLSDNEEMTPDLMDSSQEFEVI